MPAWQRHKQNAPPMTFEGFHFGTTRFHGHCMDSFQQKTGETKEIAANNKHADC
jgi:hypothetical protein